MASAAPTGSAKPSESKRPLSEEELRKMHAYWRAANYLSALCRPMQVKDPQLIGASGLCGQCGGVFFPRDQALDRDVKHRDKK